MTPVSLGHRRGSVPGSRHRTTTAGSSPDRPRRYGAIVFLPLVGAAALGCAAAGAMVPRIAYRLSVPAGGPSRRDCAGCAAPLRSGPAGWLTPRSRCGRCGDRLGPRTWITSGTAGAAGALLALGEGSRADLALYLALVVPAVLLAAIDIACRRLPDLLVLPALALAPVVLAADAAGTGRWADWRRACLGCLALGLAFGVVALLPGGGLGMGDAKTAALLGWFLGWLGWPQVALGAVLPWLVNAPVVLALLATGRAERRSRIPFGPALLAGGLLAASVAGWPPGSTGL